MPDVSVYGTLPETSALSSHSNHLSNMQTKTWSDDSLLTFRESAHIICVSKFKWIAVLQWSAHFPNISAFLICIDINLPEIQVNSLKSLTHTA
jgi:hypothetical protein